LGAVQPAGRRWAVPDPHPGGQQVGRKAKG